MAGKMTKRQLIKRVRGRMKVVSKAKRYPYTKWITYHEHVLVDNRGTYVLDTRLSKRYNDLQFMNKQEIIKILRKI
ncbi:MAG: hypothetical protein E3J43_06640 [Candidatus Heimdallarchaeota archaeon]|nr:MAG: hypothetical protein E3J43_06640 [Candidatus Heimdallarchaeota archaeon]